MIMKSKKFYTKKWFWIVVVVFLLIGFVGGSGQTDSTTEKEKENLEVEEKVSEKEELEMPIIKGTQAYDIILSLEDVGIPKAETQNLDYGYRYDSVGTDGDYSIIANKQHEIGYARFMVLQGGDVNYLAFCATMPTEDYNPEEARAWVEQNINNEATTQFGNTLFEIAQGNSGPYLTIKAVGWDDYYKNIDF